VPGQDPVTMSGDIMATVNVPGTSQDVKILKNDEGQSFIVYNPGGGNTIISKPDAEDLYDKQTNIARGIFRTELTRAKQIEDVDRYNEYKAQYDAAIAWSDSLKEILGYL